MIIDVFFGENRVMTWHRHLRTRCVHVHVVTWLLTAFCSNLIS